MTSEPAPQTFTFVFGKTGGRQTTAIQFPDDEAALRFAREKLAELYRDGGWTYVGISRGDRLFVEKLGALSCDDGTFTWVAGA